MTKTESWRIVIVAFVSSHVSAERERWLALFEREGWFRGGEPTGAADLAEVGVKYQGDAKNFMGLQYLVEANEDFLVFEYGYDAPAISMPWADAKESGTTRLWVPWASVEYVFRTRLKDRR